MRPHKTLSLALVALVVGGCDKSENDGMPNAAHLTTNEGAQSNLQTAQPDNTALTESIALPLIQARLISQCPQARVRIASEISGRFMPWFRRLAEANSYRLVRENTLTSYKAEYRPLSLDYSYSHQGVQLPIRIYDSSGLQRGENEAVVRTCIFAPNQVTIIDITHDTAQPKNARVTFTYREGHTPFGNAFLAEFGQYPPQLVQARYDVAEIRRSGRSATSPTQEGELVFRRLDRTGWRIES